MIGRTTESAGATEGPAERGTPGVIAPPPLIYLAGLALGLLLDAALPSTEVPWPVRWLLGPALVLAGLSLMRSFVLSFGRAGTPVRPDKPSTALVTGGPYTHTRNPGYLGMALLAAGIALLVATLWALFGVAAAMLVVDRGVIKREEGYLEREFGAEYVAYRSRVRRWL
jgi:protein-S-isoprenylcysteine O-methyltransferase Ste14